MCMCMCLWRARVSVFYVMFCVCVGCVCVHACVCVCRECDVRELVVLCVVCVVLSVVPFPLWFCFPLQFIGTLAHDSVLSLHVLVLC